MTVPTGRESDKFMLRLPDGMRDRIKAAAEANNRSMNAEIVSRLEASLASDKKRGRGIGGLFPPFSRREPHVDHTVSLELRDALETLRRLLEDEASERDMD